MTTLSDRLNGLADDAPAGQGPAAGSDGLWVRGRRLQRRRRAVTASFVAVLVLAIGSLATLVVDTTGGRNLPPSDADAVLGLPDQLYVASPWTEGTDDTGPLGPLVALVGAERRTFWGDSTYEITGVSTAGDYAFLDLESLATSQDGEAPVKLSPDGRWVAYPLAGATPGESDPLVDDPTVGMAVYDTVTGETLREEVPSDHGLNLDDYTWVGDTLVVSYARYLTFEDTASTFSRGSVLRWDLATGDVDPELPRRSYPDLYEATASGDRVVATTGRRSFVIVSASGDTEQGPRLDVAVDSPVFLSPDGELLATNKDPDGPGTVSNLPGSVVVGPATGPRAGSTRKIEPVVVEQEQVDEETMTGSISSVSSVEEVIVGWRDDDHLILMAGDGYEVVDVTSGVTEPLVTLPPSYGMTPQIAADALEGPIFPAAEPDGPGDPRRIVWLGGGILVLLAGAALWRHRVRR